MLNRILWITPTISPIATSNIIIIPVEWTNIESLYTQLHDQLCLYICSRTGYADEAEDILQDVFLRIHANIDSIRDLNKLEGWIYQVARNCIIDYYRRQRRAVELTEDFPQETVEEDDPYASRIPYVRELVNTLPQPYRQAILLTEYEGLTQKEMADQLGISLSGAKSRVQRARQKIKELMLECCHYEFDMRGAILDYRKKCCCCDKS